MGVRHTPQKRALSRSGCRQLAFGQSFGMNLPQAGSFSQQRSLRLTHPVHYRVTLTRIEHGST